MLQGNSLSPPLDGALLGIWRSHAVLHSGVVWRAVGPSCLVVRAVAVLPLESDEWTSRDCMRACLRNDAEAKRAPVAVPPVRTFAPAFLADCAERWTAVKRLIPPALGDRRLDAISAKGVRKGFDDLSVTRAASANRTLPVLSSTMRHAEAFGLRREVSNPCTGLRRRKTGFEAHYLTDHEFAALGRALDGAEADHRLCGPRQLADGTSVQ